MGGRIGTALRVAVSLGLITFLIWQADPEKIWAAWRNADLRLIALAVVLQFVGVAISAAKWGALLRARGHAQPYPWLLGAYLVGQFANNFLPTTVGGDALRITQLGRRIGSMSQASASVFMERLTGFLALAAIVNIALVLAFFDNSGTSLVTSVELRAVTVLFSAAAVAAIPGALLAPRLLARFGGRLPERLQRPLAKLSSAIHDYVPQGKAMVGVMIYSFAFQLLWVVIHVICGAALLINAPLLIYGLLGPITDIVGLAPLFVNNLGARELVFTVYFSQVGVATATAVALAFLIFTVRLIVSALGGLVALFGGADLRMLPIGHREPAQAER